MSLLQILRSYSSHSFTHLCAVSSLTRQCTEGKLNFRQNIKGCASPWNPCGSYTTGMLYLWLISTDEHFCTYYKLCTAVSCTQMLENEKASDEPQTDLDTVALKPPQDQRKCSCWRLSTTFIILMYFQCSGLYCVWFLFESFVVMSSLNLWRRDELKCWFDSWQ